MAHQDSDDRPFLKLEYDGPQNDSGSARGFSLRKVGEDACEIVILPTLQSKREFRIGLGWSAWLICVIALILWAAPDWLRFFELSSPFGFVLVAYVPFLVLGFDGAHREFDITLASGGIEMRSVGPRGTTRRSWPRQAIRFVTNEDDSGIFVITDDSKDLLLRADKPLQRMLFSEIKRFIS